MKIKFDVKYRPQIESGEYRVETRDGRPAKIIYWKAKDCKPIIALIPQHLMNMEVVLRFYADGQFSSDGKKTMCDLFIVTPEEELTDFEQEVSDIVEYCKKNGKNVAKGYAKRHAKELLSLAREQFIKDGYVIEKKAFYDAVKKVDPKVMKEVSENMDNTGLTEFERRIKDLLAIKCEIFYNEDIGGCYDLKGLCRVILECAREQLKPDINSMLESNYKTAYKEGYDEGKKDVLKDLPRWKKIGQGNNYSSEAEFCINGRYLEMNDTLNDIYEIFLKDLEKLPKEDEK